jgi:hypothetical protein
MLAAGIPIATVSQRLSHARASTTLNVYAHSIPGGDRKAAETLASIVAAGQRPGDDLRESEHNRDSGRGVSCDSDQFWVRVIAIRDEL